MTIKFFLLLYLTACLLVPGCSPSYKEEFPGRGGIQFFARYLGDDKSLRKFELLLVQTRPTYACASAEEAAAVRLAKRHSQSEFELLDSEISCVNLEPVTPPEMADLLSARSYKYDRGELNEPESPKISQKINRNVDSNEMFSSGSVSYYLVLSRDQIQIVLGSYGNREGLETEHTYRVVEAEERRVIQTVRFRSRVVKF